MQLAGASCKICQQGVLVDGDGTWCARCLDVLHSNCLKRADGICPTCRKAYDPPEGHFVFSRYCPVCFRFNNPPQPNCASCGEGTRWDTEPDYRAFVQHMKITAGQYARLGTGEVILGSVCFVMFAFMVYFSSKAPVYFFPGTMLCFGIVLFADGVRRIGWSTVIRKFE